MMVECGNDGGGQMIMATCYWSNWAEERSDKMASEFALSGSSHEKWLRPPGGGALQFQTLTKVEWKKAKDTSCNLMASCWGGGPRAWSALSVITGSWPGHHLSLFCITLPTTQLLNLTQIARRRPNCDVKSRLTQCPPA